MLWVHRKKLKKLPRLKLIAHLIITSIVNVGMDLVRLELIAHLIITSIVNVGMDLDK